MFRVVISIVKIAMVLGPFIQLNDWFEQAFRGNGESNGFIKIGLIRPISDSLLVKALLSRETRMEAQKHQRSSRSPSPVSSVVLSLSLHHQQRW